MATPQEKRSNFSRLFPPAVEKLLDRLRVVGQKSVKRNYDWDQPLVHDAWLEIGTIFCQTAAKFGVEMELLVDGEQVEYAERKSKRSKS